MSTAIKFSYLYVLVTDFRVLGASSALDQWLRSTTEQFDKQLGVQLRLNAFEKSGERHSELSAGDGSQRDETPLILSLLQSADNV